MTENNDTVQTTADPLLTQIAGIIDQANARENDERLQQDKRSNEDIGTALKGLMKTFNGLEGDERETFAKAAATLAKTAQQHDNPSVFMAQASNTSASSQTPSYQIDPQSAAYLLREQLALLDSIRDTRRGEFDGAVEFVKKVLNESFGPDAERPGFGEYQLMFSGGESLPGMLYSARLLIPVLRDVLTKAGRLTDEAEAMLAMPFDTSQSWQNGDLVFEKSYRDEVEALLRELKELVKRADRVPTPTSRRTTIALDGGDSADPLNN